MTEDQDLMVQYSSHLQDFLLRLKKEVDLTTASIPRVSSLPDLDNYLYKINAFYYQSFATQFMPVYQQQIQQVVTDKLNLSRTESMVKKDVMAIIKRYAGLYNQVKTISARLGSLSRETRTRTSGLELDQRILTAQIGEMLEQLRENLSRLHKSVQPVAVISQDHEYTSALASSSLSREVKRVLAGLDPGDLNIARETNQFCQAIKLFLLAASELAHLTTVAEGLVHLNNMKKLDHKLINLNVPELQSLCRDSLNPFMSWNLQLIDLYLKQPDLANAAAVASELYDWLLPLKIVLQRKQFLQQPDTIISPVIEAQSLADLDQRICNSIQNTEALITEACSHSGVEWEEVMERIASMVQTDYPYYYHWSSEAGTGLSAFPYLNRVCLDLFLLTTRLEADQARQNACRLLTDYYQEMNDWVHKYLRLLDNISADLERLLAPRNLTRIWKGMDIRVEHVILEEGQPFPTEYMHLLDKHQVEVRLSAADLTVLQAEGDLFIIRVDDLLEEEMPYLVTSMKG